MDLNFILTTAGFFILLFSLLGFWQRKLERRTTERRLRELREARDRGTNKALTQHPQIRLDLCIGCGSCMAACPEDNVLGMVNGTAHVINGSRCIGHAKCQDACPVGAITVGLGDIQNRPDIPHLSPEFETSVPGIFIAGELGGIALIRHAIDQGMAAVDVIADRLMKNPVSLGSDVCDVLIVGSGPAGLSAALRCCEKKLRYRIIAQEDMGGTVRKYPRRKLTLVQSVHLPLHGLFRGREYTKEEIIGLWAELIQKHKINVESNNALISVEKKDGFFESLATNGKISSRNIILALGRRGTPRKLNVAGEELDKVFYQLIDAASYTGQHLLVVGGGDSAIEAAMGLANQKGNCVTVSYRKENFNRLKSRNEERIKEYISSHRLKVIFSSEVKQIKPKSVVYSVLVDGSVKMTEIPNDFVFVFAGGELPFPLLKQMGIRFGGSSSVAA